LSIGTLVLVLLMTVAAFGCASDDTTATTAGSTDTAAGGSTTTASDTSAPVAGGTLRHINTQGPQDLGFWPKQGPTDEGAIFPAVERIMTYTTDRTLVPFLAKSVVEDPEALTITVELNEGIMFHDGTELTADVAAWNYQIGKDGAKLQFGDALSSIEVTGKYGYVLHLNQWHNQLINSFGWVPMFSKDAFEKNGGEEWALSNVVGTGPFKLETFSRDESLIWVKNANYWREGLPYLDRIEVSVIPDATTSSALMQSGQADIWQNADAQAQAEMIDKGIEVQTGWSGFEYHLMPNTKSPDSVFKDLKVREAVEYALDRPAISEAIGFGRYVPLVEVAPEGEWGAGSSTHIRESDPAKAKQLLTEAGYPDGLAIDLLAPMGTGGRNVAAEAIKGYLDAAGFKTNIDIADPGRFYGSVFGGGWKDLALMFSGLDVNYLVSATRWWGPSPMTNLGSFERPADLVALFDKAVAERDFAVQEKVTGEIVAKMNEQALMIPVYHFPAGLVIADYVHTMYPKAGLAAWDYATFWMDEH